MDNGFVQDVLLKVIKTAVPGTARIMIDFRECSVMKFGPNAKSCMFVEFVPFGESSTGSPFARDSTVSKDPATYLSFENTNEVVSCHVWYQECSDKYHYATALGDVSTPVHFCSVPAKSHLVPPPMEQGFKDSPQYRAIVDLAHLGIAVQVIPLDVTAGLACEILSWFDSAGVIIRYTGTDQAGKVHYRLDKRIY